MSNISDLMSKLTTLDKKKRVTLPKSGRLIIYYKDGTEKTVVFTNTKEFIEMRENVFKPLIGSFTAREVDLQVDKPSVEETDNDDNSKYPSQVFTLNGVMVHLTKA